MTISSPPRNVSASYSPDHRLILIPIFFAIASASAAVLATSPLGTPIPYCLTHQPGFSFSRILLAHTDFSRFADRYSCIERSLLCCATSELRTGLSCIPMSAIIPQSCHKVIYFSDSPDSRADSALPKLEHIVCVGIAVLVVVAKVQSTYKPAAAQWIRSTWNSKLAQPSILQLSSQAGGKDGCLAHVLLHCIDLHMPVPQKTDLRIYLTTFSRQHKQCPRQLQHSPKNKM